MTQQVIPGNSKIYPEILTKMIRNSLRIHPAEKFNTEGGIQGYYRTATGEIFLGTFEKTTIDVVFHEIMHKIFYEFLDLNSEAYKTTLQWDNIAQEIEEFLFNIQFEKWAGYSFKEAIEAFGSEEKYLKFIGVK